MVDGAVHAQLPFYGDPAEGVPAETFVMQPSETPLVTVLREVTRVSPARIDLVLFTWIDFVAYDERAPEVEVALVEVATGQRLELAADGVRDAAGDATSRPPLPGLPPRRRVRAASTPRRWSRPAAERAAWRLELTVRYRGLERRGGVDAQGLPRDRGPPHQPTARPDRVGRGPGRLRATARDAVPGHRRAWPAGAAARPLRRAAPDRGRLEARRGHARWPR